MDFLFTVSFCSHQLPPFKLHIFIVSGPNFIYHAEEKTTAAEYLARGRIKSSGMDEDIINSEEVKKELSALPSRNYRRSLSLWDRYVNRQMPRTSVPADSHSTDIKPNSYWPAYTT